MARLGRHSVPRWLRAPTRPVLLVTAALVALCGLVWTLAQVSGGPAPSGVASVLRPGPAHTPSPRAVLVLPTPGATVPWADPLRVAVTDGRLGAVRVTGPAGVVSGTSTATGWSSTTSLLPSSSYRVSVVTIDGDGQRREIEQSVNTTAASSVLRVTLSPDARTVGVGAPILATFNRPVIGAVARAAVLARLRVRAVPAADGGWHWVNDTEAHYRGRSYWLPGTAVTVSADLGGLRLPGTGTWGSPTPHVASFRIGDSLVSTVDVARHTMTVRRNGLVLRVLPVSTGRDKYPTKGGVHIVLALVRVQVFDSATVGIARTSPDGYFEKLPYSVRISNGGAFVHANPATVRFQGVLNVSHGCVNLSLADAAWFFSVSHLGDVVNVLHAAAPPVLSDPGMSDWNLTFSQWRGGNA